VTILFHKDQSYFLKATIPSSCDTEPLNLCHNLLHYRSDLDHATHRLEAWTNWSVYGVWCCCTADWTLELVRTVVNLPQLLEDQCCEKLGW